MTNINLPPFIQALLDPEFFQLAGGEPELVQTHISYVILAGDFVYKFKKPVDFGFLDFSDLDKRLHCCEQELRLNRRLCPDIYLDLVRVTREGEGFVLDGSGEVVEYGIKMVRMPEERMMGNVIAAGELNRQHIDHLVETLVPFYQAAEGGEKLTDFGTAAGVGVNVLENFDQTEAFIGKGALDKAQFDAIKSYSQSILDDSARFEERIKGGFIRDCHGDLYSANICLADKIYIYDCIEFNDRFRYSDVASDIAFLAMDLDFHGLPELSSYFVNRFIELSKDPGLAKMLNFYKCYRAYVRGKIGLFTAADPAVEEPFRSQCIENAAKYFNLASSYVEKHTA